MTIDEAIEHAKRVAASCEGECADNHRQLVEWLRELVLLRKIVAVRDDATWQAIHEHEELKVENERLRELTRRLLTEYRYMRVRPRRVYLGHEARMRAIEEEMRELRIEV